MTARRKTPNPVSRTTAATNGTTPLTAADRHFCPPTNHQGLLEPDASRGARPVLRGAERSNALGLPGEQQAAQHGHRASTALDNGFASCEDPSALAEVCDSLSAAGCVGVL